MRKMEKKPSADHFRNCIYWKYHQRDDNERPIYTNDVETEESKSLINLDSAEGDLGGSDAGGRTKIRTRCCYQWEYEKKIIRTG